MAEAKLLDQAQTPAKTRYYPWQWHDQPVTVAYDLQGDGPPVLLLPALSSISTRAEFNACGSKVGSALSGNYPRFGQGLGHLTAQPGGPAQRFTTPC